MLISELEPWAKSAELIRALAQLVCCQMWGDPPAAALRELARVWGIPRCPELFRGCYRLIAEVDDFASIYSIFPSIGTNLRIEGGRTLKIVSILLATCFLSDESLNILMNKRLRNCSDWIG
jgi:hypothetical protein